MIEEWRPVAGWEDTYEVSCHGRVRRKANNPGRYKTELILSQKVQKKGVPYRIVALKTKARGQQMAYVHHLVAIAFIGPRPDGLDCCHNDSDPANNSKGNVRWDTKAGNEADKVARGTANRGERHGMSRVNRQRRAVAVTN